MYRGTRISVVVCVAWILASAFPAEAQWIAVGRKALGKVKELTQSEKTGTPGYSVATVMVASQGEKVFAAALRTIQSSKKLRLTQKDDAKLTLEFADGQRIVGLQVTQIGEDVTQLLIASATVPGSPDETSAVAGAALRICKELGAECSLVAPDQGAKGTPASVSQPTPPR